MIFEGDTNLRQKKNEEMSVMEFIFASSLIAAMLPFL